MDALRRELREEIGIAIEQPRPLLRLRHSYSYGDVLLDVWVVRRYRGEPRGLDGQSLRWCSRSSLQNAGLLPADRPIIGALRLPERLRVVETPYYRVHAFEDFMAGHSEGSRPDGGRPLRGVSCRHADDACAAVSAGADFVALDDALGAGELTDLCGSHAGVRARPAMGVGARASGINELG